MFTSVSRLGAGLERVSLCRSFFYENSFHPNLLRMKKGIRENVFTLKNMILIVFYAKEAPAAGSNVFFRKQKSEFKPLMH